MSDALNELLIIGPLVAKVQVADILDWVSPLFSNVTYRDGKHDDLFISTYFGVLPYAYRSLDRLPEGYFVFRYRGTRDAYRWYSVGGNPIRR